MPSPSGARVWVAEHGGIASRAVRRISIDDTQVEIAGVVEGEWVVRDAARRLDVTVRNRRT